MDILENDVGSATDQAETLSSNHTGIPDTDDTLVACNIDWISSSYIISHRHNRVAGAAPIGTVQRVLTARTTSVTGWPASIFRVCALGSDEIELLVDEDNPV